MSESPGPHPSNAQRRPNRTRSVLFGTASAAGGRIVSTAVGLLVVSLTVQYMGSERYGVWMTMSAAIGWLQLADMGMANGLTNDLAAAHAVEDESRLRELLANGLAALGILGALVVLAALCAYALVDVGALFRVHSSAVRAEISGAVLCAAVLFAASLPLAIVDKYYVATQRGWLANLWSMAAALLGLLAILLAARFEAGLFALVLALSGTRVLVSLLSIAWLFLFHRPSLRPSSLLLRRSTVAHIWQSGRQYLKLQAGALVLYNSDNIVIASLLGAAAVTPYAVTWKLVSLSSVAAGMVAPYMWPAYVDALERKDSSWIVATFRKSMILALGVTVPASLLLVWKGADIIEWWVGPEARPSTALLWWMGAWSTILAAMSAAGSLLNASGRVSRQATLGLAMAGVNIALSIAGALVFGSTGVIAATVGSYLVIVMFPALLQLRGILRDIRTGVWWAETLSK